MAYAKLNLGYDRGNERTNACIVNDMNKIVKNDIARPIAQGYLRHYDAVMSGSGVKDGLTTAHTSKMHLTYDGITYFIGDFANQGENPTNGFSDPDRYQGKHTQISLMAVCAQLASRLYPYQNAQELAVNLVMGVPIQAYREKADVIAEALRSVYRYNYNGKEYSLHVDDVRVFMEGAGAGICAGLDSAASIGIVDSGSFTTNILRFDGARPNTKDCVSFPIGVGTATARLNKWFEREYNRELSTSEQQQILRASIGVESYPILYADGREVSQTLLSEWIRKALSETGIERNTRIAKHWSKQTINSMKSVIHCGGGAYYFDVSLKKIIRSTTVMMDSEKLNARGYAVLSNQI